MTHEELIRNKEWIEDCIKWWGRVLIGAKAHWCYDWDALPIDETTEEFSCCTCSWDGEDGLVR